MPWSQGLKNQHSLENRANLTVILATPTSTRRIAAVVAGIMFSCLFLWLALRKANIAEIGDALHSANKYWVVPVLFVLFAFYWLKSMRWRNLLTPVKRLKTSELFPIVMIGYGGTAILPMQMGELVRAYIASRRYSLSLALVLSSIGLERIFDLLTVLALLCFVLVTGEHIPDYLVSAGYVIGFGCLLVLALCMLFIKRTEAATRMVSVVFAWLPAALRQKVEQQVESIARGLQALGDPRLLSKIILNSIAQWLLMGCCILFSLWALDITVSLSAAVLVLLATVIGISLPTGPGYIGNIQLAFTIALQPFGISAGDAVAASIYYHITAYSAVVVVGFFFLHRYGYRLNQLAEESTADEAVDPRETG